LILSKLMKRVFEFAIFFDGHPWQAFDSLPTLDCPNGFDLLSFGDDCASTSVKVDSNSDLQLPALPVAQPAANQSPSEHQSHPAEQHSASVPVKQAQARSSLAGIRSAPGANTKHETQQVALVRCLQLLHLLSADRIYVEMGCVSCLLPTAV
jgi:hypothetical protein